MLQDGHLHSFFIVVLQKLHRSFYGLSIGALLQLVRNLQFGSGLSDKYSVEYGC